MMERLTPTELDIAEKYCHGLTDKEVACETGSPVWTIRTHKKHIHSKLGISTTHELVLYMVARETGRDWDVKELRKRGLSAVLALLILLHHLFIDEQFCRTTRRTRVEYIERRAEQ